MLESWLDLFLRPRAWGARPGELERRLPCDALLPDADDCFVRACDVRATPARVFRWLSQVQVAPYSYDWIDNGGRQSPRRLVPGLDRLEVGQTMVTIFTLASFVPDEQITMVMLPRAARIFGDVTLTYTVAPQGGGSRLLGRICVRYPRGVRGALMRLILPLGDAIMMRKQLLTLKALAEKR